MKKIYLIISRLIFIVIVVIFVGNYSIRVSSGDGKSIGIFEDIIFGKSIFSLLQPNYSENYKKFDIATEGSYKVASIIDTHGPSLFNDKDLENIRLQAIDISSEAYNNAKNVDMNYLKNSNEELPAMFSIKLTNALKLWTEGLEQKDTDKIIEGIKLYNDFLSWIESKDSNEFKKLR